MNARALSGYQALMAEATGVTDPGMLDRIEDTMRHVVFHSTLDWQDRETLMKGAREAYGIERLKDRGTGKVVTPEDAETARLLGVDAVAVPELASLHRKMVQSYAGAA